MKPSSLIVLTCTAAALWATLTEPAAAWAMNGIQPKLDKVTASSSVYGTEWGKPSLLAAIVGATIMLASAPLTTHAFDPQTFNHQYNDPKHPNCKRIVVVRKDGGAAISGTDGSPGCPEDGTGNVWRLVGDVEENTILVDFSPKVR